MSQDPTPVTRAISPWWVLLILPVAACIGWGIGQIPVSKRPEPKAATRQSGTTVSSMVSSTASTAVVSSPREAATGGGSVSKGGEADSRPPEAEKPAEETPRTEVSQWTTLENAMAESARNGKPVLIDFNADWCGPCQRMKQQVFEDGELGQVVQTSVIPVSIVDQVREGGRNPPEIEALQQRFEVDAFPTLVVFSPATGRALKTKGFGGAEETLAWITGAAKAVR